MLRQPSSSRHWFWPAICVATALSASVARSSEVPSKPPTDSTAASFMQQRVCRSSVPTGSRIAKVTCRTRADLEAEKKATEEIVNQMRAPVRSPPPSSSQRGRRS